MGGISGAFLLLPFQMSFLNFTSPSVSSTNFVYNIVAIPSGVYRYIKEGRMAMASHMGNYYWNPPRYYYWILFKGTLSA